MKEPYVELKQGNQAKWRWYARTFPGGALIASGPVQGFHTEEEAGEAARQALRIGETKHVAFFFGVVCGISVVATVLILFSLFRGA